MRNKFRVRGDTVAIYPVYTTDTAIRIEFFGDEIDRISEINPLTGEIKNNVSHVAIYPASNYVVSPDKLDEALEAIRNEMSERYIEFTKQGKLLEAQRIKDRTLNDLELLKETGFCKGIENYSRIMSGRPVGAAPFTLLDYFPDDFLLFVLF